MILLFISEQSDPDYVDVSKEDGRLNDTLVSESPKKSDKFEWGTTILSLLEKKGEISYKKLRRKVYYYLNVICKKKLYQEFT